MAIKKGVVLELEGSEAIVLTDRGEFERVPLGRRKLDIGMEITLPSRRRSAIFGSKRWTGWVASAAAVLFVAIAPLLSQVMQPSEVFAYVDIDINPSIRLAVNEDKRVVAADPLNNDGRRVLSEATVVGQGMEAAAAHITQQAIEDGFISNNRKNAVILALTPAQGNRIALIWENRLKEAVTGALQEQQQVAEVETRVGSTELRLAATKQGLSVGKFMMLLAAREENLPITVAEVKKNPIGNVIRGLGSSTEELAKVERNTKDWDQIAAKYGPELEGGNPTSTTTALAAPSGGKGVTDKPGTPLLVANGGDKQDGNTNLDQIKDPTGEVRISVLNPKGKKPKKTPEGGKVTDTTQGNTPAGQGTDKKPDDQANGTKPGEPTTVTKPTDGQIQPDGNTGSQDTVKLPVDPTKAPASMGVDVPAGAALAPEDLITPNTNSVQNQTNP
ncbi:MAG: anti-sigma factor domain-containing protein [Carboxydocellales bacterium]